MKLNKIRLNLIVTYRFSVIGTKSWSKVVVMVDDGKRDARWPDEQDDGHDAKLCTAQVVGHDWTQATEVLDGHEHEWEDGDEKTGDGGEPLQVTDGLVVWHSGHDGHHGGRQDEDGDHEMSHGQTDQVATATDLKRVDHGHGADNEDAAHCTFWEINNVISKL